MEPAAPVFVHIRLPAAVADAIRVHARQSAPEECCGLLLGQASHIVEAWPAANIAGDRTRTYTIDPVDHFAALRAARARGLEVIGAYHSHPRSAAVPSATDRDQAFPHFLFLIAGLGGEVARLAAWELVGGNFVPVPLVGTAEE